LRPPRLRSAIDLCISDQAAFFSLQPMKQFAAARFATREIFL